MVAANEAGRLELFAVGSDGSLWHIWQTGAANNDGWSAWYSHGAPAGGLQSTPALARNQEGRLELLVVGADGALWHIWQTKINNGWSGWFSHGAPPNATLKTAPALALNEAGRLELFAVGTDGKLWHVWQLQQNGGWGDWFSHGTP